MFGKIKLIIFVIVAALCGFFYFLAGVDIDFGQGTRQTEGQYTEIPGCYGSGILMVESA